MLKILTALLSVFIISCGSSSCSTTTALTVISQIRPVPRSSTKIPARLTNYNIIFYQNDDKPACAGTIVGIRKGVVSVITAAHCVVNRMEEVIPFGFIELDKRTKLRVEVAKICRAQDLALVRSTDRVTGSTDDYIAPVARVTPEVGSWVWIVGFGGGQKDIVSHGTVAMEENQDPKDPIFHAIVLDGSAYYGSSGGGVFNEDGELVGVISRNGPNAHGLWVYAVHPLEIRMFLYGEIL